MTLKTIKELNHYMKEEGLMILVDDVNKLIDEIKKEIGNPKTNSYPIWQDEGYEDATKDLLRELKARIDG